MTGPTDIPRIAGIEDMRLIGRGGFATVYRGHQAAFRRDVAVKVLQRSGLDEQDRRRFDRECQAMGALSGHPSIVTLYDAGYTDDGQPYLVMAYVADGTLHDRLAREGPLNAADVTRLGIRLSGALETAHRAGVLHRDIKPANVLRGKYGDQLSDFGIARIQGGHETQTGLITASVNHAAPEILDGQPPTPAADVYGLASTLYEAVTGMSAFARDTDEGLLPLIRRVVTEPPPDLRQRGVPAPLAEVIEKAMSKDPADRHSTAEEFGLALRGAQSALGLPLTELVVVSASAPPDEGGAPTVGVVPIPPSELPGTTTVAPAADRSPTATPDDESPDRTNVMPTVAPIGVAGAAGVATTVQPAVPSAERSAIPPTIPPTHPPDGPPAAHWRPDTDDSGGPKQAILIMAVIVALVAGGAALWFLVLDDDATAGPSPSTVAPGSTVTPDSTVAPTTDAPGTTVGPTTSVAPTTDAPGTTVATTVATTIAPPTTLDPQTPAGALAQLDQFLADDAAVVASIAENWVPQLSAKTVGLEADFITYGPVDILQDHLGHRFDHGAVLADGGTYNFEIDDQPMTGWYITLVPIAFDSADGALAWCTLQGFDRENCFARFVSNVVFDGTTKLNP